MERARYDADRAERAFHAAEPENRLVVRTLEARWEARLAALAEAEAALAATRNAAPPLPARADLQALIGDLPRLWHADTTTARDRKRLLRTLIADVTVLPETDRAKVRVGIRWHTGATDEITADRPRPPIGPAVRHPGPGRRADPRARPHHQQRRPRHPAQRGRAPHRQGPPVRRRRRPMGPPRPQDPHPRAARPRRDQRRRRRRPARHQRRRRLLLDQGRAPARPPRPRQPPRHHLDTRDRGQLPTTDRQLRPPQPTAIPTHPCRRGSMKPPSRPSADRVVAGGAEAGAGADLRGGLPAVLLRVPPEPAGAGRDRRDPPLHGTHRLRVGAGGRHRGVLRRDRPHRP